jgi:hypothetical protein
MFHLRIRILADRVAGRHSNGAVDPPGAAVDALLDEAGEEHPDGRPGVPARVLLTAQAAETLRFLDGVREADCLRSIGPVVTTSLLWPSGADRLPTEAQVIPPDQDAVDAMAWTGISVVNKASSVRVPLGKAGFQLRPERAPRASWRRPEVAAPLTAARLDSRVHCVPAGRRESSEHRPPTPKKRPARRVAGLSRDGPGASLFAAQLAVRVPGHVGIYRRRDDRLWLCLRGAERGYPTKFGDDDRQQLLILRWVRLGG